MRTRYQRERIGRLEVEMEMLKRQRDAASDKFMKYGDHLPCCDKCRNADPAAECNCGYSAAAKQHDEERP